MTVIASLPACLVSGNDCGWAAGERWPQELPPLGWVSEHHPQSKMEQIHSTIYCSLHPPPSPFKHSNLPHLLLTFSRQIAGGMAYLSSKDFVHRELATRYILLDRRLNCKVCVVSSCMSPSAWVTLWFDLWPDPWPLDVCILICFGSTSPNLFLFRLPISACPATLTVSTTSRKVGVSLSNGPPLRHSSTTSTPPAVTFGAMEWSCLRYGHWDESHLRKRQLRRWVDVYNIVTSMHNLYSSPRMCTLTVHLILLQIVQMFKSKNGYCQAPPPGCPREIYAVMVKCWWEEGEEEGGCREEIR